MIPILGMALAGLAAKVIYRNLNQESIPARRIFISHSWQKSSRDYDLLINRLNSLNVKFYNHSIPQEKAFDENSRSQLEKIFRQKMVYCSKIFVLAHPKITEDSFIGTEIKIARNLKKEIITIKPRNVKRVPAFLKKNSDMIISTNKEALKRIWH